MDIEAQARREIGAPPELLYRIVRDYREHHPRILPKPTFESLTVLEGGVGAGTVVRVVMRVMGTRSALTMEVREPEPGRVLEEVDRDSGAVTSFVFEPLADGARTSVTIRTRWPRRAGVRGWLDSKTLPRVATRLYEEELAKLASYAASLASGPAPIA